MKVQPTRTYNKVYVAIFWLAKSNLDRNLLIKRSFLQTI